MKAALFDYSLPASLIAQKPAYPRDTCNLMHIQRAKGKITHRIFKDLPRLLRAGDVLVFNDSKVIPARILFKHNGFETEIFLTRKINPSDWLAIGRPGRRLKEGAVFEINDDLRAEVMAIREDGQRIVRFTASGRKLAHVLEKAGITPLPPYIKDCRVDSDEYQTVYAAKKGSVAAPTAGLHFTERIMEELAKKGIDLRFVTLHVGPGTFLPIKTDNVKEHKMHSEFYEMSGITAAALNRARIEKRRIIAVGTTAVRVLESSFVRGAGFKAGFGETAIYIYPGYKWKCIDALITNFHLPKSTLLLLTCSFGGRRLILKAYKEAVKMKYRFFSFGDAMMIE